MRKKGEERGEHAADTDGSMMGSSLKRCSSPSTARFSSILRQTALLGAILFMAIFYAALVSAQDDPRDDASQETVIIEQVIGEENPAAGFVARTSRPDESVSIREDAARTASWTASSAMRMVLMVALVTLVGYLVGVYHRGRDTKKGTFGSGSSSCARIIQTSRALTTGARSHARAVGQFFSRRRKPSAAVVTRVGSELESYLRRRHDGTARPASPKRPTQSSVSSHEDEYWQRQKERFWSRVQRAADRADAPRTIQQLAVKQVQRYNEAMARIRQARDDLYDADKAETNKTDSGQAFSDIDQEDHVPADNKAVQQQSILNQLKEAHSI